MEVNQRSSAVVDQVDLILVLASLQLFTMAEFYGYVLLGLLY